VDEDSPLERRRVGRRPLQARARIRPNDWSSLEIDLVDFTEEGFRAACEANLKIGTFISVEVPGNGVVSAKIIWRSGEALGAKFVQPIDLRHCEWTSEVPRGRSDFQRALASVQLEPDADMTFMVVWMRGQVAIGTEALANLEAAIEHTMDQLPQMQKRFGATAVKVVDESGKPQFLKAISRD
jgi:hypothetical protein